MSHNIHIYSLKIQQILVADQQNNLGPALVAALAIRAGNLSARDAANVVCNRRPSVQIGDDHLAALHRYAQPST